jgi:hypothetical protein
MDKNGGVTEQMLSLFDPQHVSAQTGYHHVIIEEY